MREKIFKGIVSKKLPTNIQKTARRKLLYLDEADSLCDLATPLGNRFEALHEAREGQHSIRINDQWQICFTWANSMAKDIEIVDYHPGKDEILCKSYHLFTLEKYCWKTL